MKQTKTSSSLILTGLLLFVVIFVFFIYTFLHEAGHAIVGLLTGRSLTEFNVSFWNFSAHVGMAGGELTQSQLALQSAAGAGLPLLLWTIWISLVPRKGNLILESLKLISSMAVVNTLLAWMILPVWFMFGNAPSDDVTYFLRYSHMLPLLLTFTATLLYIGGWVLFLSKIDGLRNEFRLFSTGKGEVLTAGWERTVPVMAGTLAFCLVLVFWLNASASKNSLDRFSPPQDFASIAQIDLSTRPYFSESLTQFSLDESGYVSVFVSVRNIDTTYFDLTVTGPNRFHEIILHGEGYKANQDGGLWEKKLPAGTYQVVLTSHQSPGTALIYLKTD
jgi:hypothetical protein